MLSIWKTIRVPMHMLVSSVLTLLPYTIPERGCAIFFHCSKGANWEAASGFPKPIW